jgi:hypothetical protein
MLLDLLQLTYQPSRASLALAEILEHLEGLWGLEIDERDLIEALDELYERIVEDGYCAWRCGVIE